MFSKNNMLLILFLCVVIFGMSYYKTANPQVVTSISNMEGYSNLVYADSPPKYKMCPN
jgi:hypothetical protein